MPPHKEDVRMFPEQHLGFPVLPWIQRWAWSKINCIWWERRKTQSYILRTVYVNSEAIKTCTTRTQPQPKTLPCCSSHHFPINPALPPCVACLLTGLRQVGGTAWKWCIRKSFVLIWDPLSSDVSPQMLRKAEETMVGPAQLSYTSSMWLYEIHPESLSSCFQEAFQSRSPLLGCPREHSCSFHRFGQTYCCLRHSEWAQQ